MITGAAEGFALRYVGLLRSVAGRSARVALMAACTSRAAASMLRFRSNCRLMRDEPVPLLEVISLTPAMVPSRRSRGVATLLAMFSGLAPGMLAETEITGKSTCGSGATGSTKNAAMPASAIQMVSRTVATGRRTKGAERFKPASRERVGVRSLGAPAIRREVLAGNIGR